MDSFLTFMKLKPRFYEDPKAPHCSSLLPPVPGTVPAQGYLCGLQCQQLCWEQDQGFLSIGMYTVTVCKPPQNGALSSVGLAVAVTVPANNRTGS